MRWKAHFFLSNNEEKKKKRNEQGRCKIRNLWIQIKAPSRSTDRVTQF